MATSHYQNTTRELQAEPDSEGSDDETISVDVEDTTLLEYEAEAETSAWDTDKTLVGNANLISLQTVARTLEVEHRLEMSEKLRLRRFAITGSRNVWI